MSRLKKLLLLLLLLPVLAVGGFVLWAQTTPAPMAEALAALESDAPVQVTTDRWLVFTPANEEPTAGLILYPGGRVNPRSYSPAARAVAGEGYLVVIVPMPLNLAVFASDAAADVIAAHPDVSHLGHRRSLAGRGHGSALCLRPPCRGAGAGPLGCLPG